MLQAREEFESFRDESARKLQASQEQLLKTTSELQDPFYFGFEECPFGRLLIAAPLTHVREWNFLRSCSLMYACVLQSYEATSSSRRVKARVAADV